MTDNERYEKAPMIALELLCFRTDTESLQTDMKKQIVGAKHGLEIISASVTIKLDSNVAAPGP